MTKNIYEIAREAEILKFVTKSAKGLEIAPWHSPVAPKRDGFNIRVLDVFDTPTLQRICRADELSSPYVDRIEEVDFVCSAPDIAEAVAKGGENGTFDYIISSHNFEHLPDPIRFLRGCGDVLKAGGYLSMAIPDKRRTFDYVRTLSRTSDLLRNYLEKRIQPSVYDIFEHRSALVGPVEPLKELPVENISWSSNLEVEYERLTHSAGQAVGYDADVHVTVFTPESFRAVILDLIRLDLIPFQLVDIVDSPAHEFYVHLKNVGYGHSSRALLTDQYRLDVHMAAFRDDLPSPQRKSPPVGPMSRFKRKLFRLWNREKGDR